MADDFSGDRKVAGDGFLQFFSGCVLLVFLSFSPLSLLWAGVLSLVLSDERREKEIGGH